jgi:opacity protein-like surface antigen
MKFLKATLVATAISAFATSAQAQDSGAYVNLGVQTYEFDTWNLLGRVGYNFSENFGVEADAGLGVADTTVDGFDVSTPFNFGGYLVARYPVSQQFEIFGRVGYASTKFEVEDESATFDGIAYGGGIQYNFDEANGLRLGYTANDVDVGTADVLDLTYVRKF